MKLLTILILTFISSLSYSAGIENFTIKSVGISEGSYTIFVDTFESHDESECSDKNSLRYKVNDTSLYREIYSGLLAAKMSGSAVQIAFTSDLESCLYNAPQILSISIL